MFFERRGDRVGRTTSGLREEAKVARSALRLEGLVNLRGRLEFSRCRATMVSRNPGCARAW